MGLCSALVGSSPVCSALVGSGLVCSTLVGSCLVCSALVGSCLVCSALVVSGLVCSALVLCSAGFTSVPCHFHMDLALCPSPRFHLRSTTLLDCSVFGVSGSRSLGGGSVTDPVHGLPLSHHQRSLTHHMDSCTTLTVALHLRLQFPSPIALTIHALNMFVFVFSLLYCSAFFTLPVLAALRSLF